MTRREQVGTTMRFTVRTLGRADVPAIAQVHLAAFPTAALTHLGIECVRSYYAWHISGRHALATFGVEIGGELAGYCVVVRYNNLAGFVRRYFLRLAGALLCRPRLVVAGLFRQRLIRSVHALLRPPATCVPGSGARLLAIAVDPQSQRRGIGAVLIEHAEQTAAGAGVAVIGLSVHPDNKQAIRVYERHGWKRVMNGPDWSGAMEKRLALAPLH